MRQRKISMSDDVSLSLGRLAKQSGKSRSQVIEDLIVAAVAQPQRVEDPGVAGQQRDQILEYARKTFETVTLLAGIVLDLEQRHSAPALSDNDPEASQAQPHEVPLSDDQKLN